jgi:hypothetical protein
MMVRAAIAAFGVPFILGMGALAVYRNTKDLFLPVGREQQASRSDSSSSDAEKKEAAPGSATPETVDVDEVARRRALDLKQEQLRGLDPQSVVREWMTALAEKEHDAANAVNQQALGSAAAQFASVFLTKRPPEAALADLRPALDYDVLDKCLASLRSLKESSLRDDLQSYIRSKVVKLAEIFEMQPVDRDRLAALAAKIEEAASTPDGK